MQNLSLIKRFALTLGILTILSACSRQPSPRPIKTGTTPLAMDYKQVDQIEINSVDSRLGKRWSATFQTTTPGDPLSWKIVAAPEGAELSDRMADGTFIQHLLDTLGSLRVDSIPGEASLPSLGLDPPRTLIRYRFKEGAKTPSDEIRFGLAIDGVTSRYAQLGPRLKEAASAAFVARGATLKMLEYMTGFDVLRRRNLMSYELDDLDEIRLYRSGREVFFAERQGDDWINRRRRLNSESALGLLNHLVHLKIRSFADEDPEVARFSATPNEVPRYRAILVPRVGEEVRIDFFPIKSGFVAILKERREGKFGLHVETEAGLTRWPK